MNLSIKRLIYFSLFFWILNFLWSIFTINPNVDDAWYYMQSLGFGHLNELASHSDNYTYYDFSKFPGYPLIQGIFIKFFLFLKIPINFYTYRIVPLFIFCLLILFTFKLIEILAKDKSDILYKKFFFLILVSISPLSMVFMNNRPDLLALMFLIIGIFFYLKSNKDISRSSLNLFLSGFFLGLSVITHPIYFFFNLFLVPIILFNNLDFRKFFYFLFSFSIPLFIFLFYYYLYFPMSVEQLMLSSTGFPFFGYFFAYLKNFFNHQNIYINLIYFYYHIPYFFCLFFLIFIYLKKFFNKSFLFKKNEIIKLIIFISVLFILFVERNTLYNHFVFSYLIFIVFISHDYFKKIKLYFQRYFLKLPNLFLLIIIFLMICSWNILHTLKYSRYPDQYLSNIKFLKFKDLEIINNQRKFIITRSEFIPFFINEYNNYYLTNFKRLNYYWLFPNYGGAILKYQKKFSKELITKKFINKDVSEYFWIIAEKNIIKKEKKFICFSIYDVSRLNQIDLKLDNYLVNYSTNKYIVLNSTKVSLDCE